MAVRVSIVAGSAGFLVLYLIVLADLLVGELAHGVLGCRRYRDCSSRGVGQACAQACCGLGLGERKLAPLPAAAAAHAAAGTQEFTGIIPDLWPDLPDPLPWYLQRAAMLTWAALLVAPALSEFLGGQLGGHGRVARLCATDGAIGARCAEG